MDRSAPGLYSIEHVDLIGIPLRNLFAPADLVRRGAL